MKTFNVYWAPEGKLIATVRARDTRAAKRKAPMPYRKYLGEMYAWEVNPQAELLAEVAKLEATPTNVDASALIERIGDLGVIVADEARKA